MPGTAGKASELSMRVMYKVEAGWSTWMETLATSPAHGAMRAHGYLAAGAYVDEVGRLRAAEGDHDCMLALQQHGLHIECMSD